VPEGLRRDKSYREQEENSTLPMKQKMHIHAIETER
jgi:hypothetical protein